MQPILKHSGIFILATTILCDCSKEDLLWNTHARDKIQNKEMKKDFEIQRKERGTFSSWTCFAYSNDKQAYHYSSQRKKNARRVAAAICKRANDNKTCLKTRCQQREF